MSALPSRPNLEHLKNQARDLVKAHRRGESEALARIGASLPRLQEVPREQLAAAKFTILDAQLVLAREYGFPSWPKLKIHVESIAGRTAKPHRPFEKNLEYYTDRARGLLSVHRTGQRHALKAIRRSHPAYSQASDEEIRSATLTLDDVQLVFAREHGYDDWPVFAAYVAALAKGDAQEPFMAAFQAIQAGDEAVFAALLDRHPDLLDAQGTNGNSLLNLALSCKREAHVRMLLDRGADVDLANNKGWTPLHQAAYSNQALFTGWLLEAGASVEAEAHGEGGTPLVQALFWGHHALAIRLAEHGIAPDNLRVAAGLGRLDLVKACFQANGSLKPHAGAKREFHRPHSGFPPWTPGNDRQEILDEALVWACKNGQTGVLGFLVEQGADVNADPYRGTPLTWAARNNQAETVRWLLDHGADPNRRGTFGGPGHGEGVAAIHLAAQMGRHEVIKLLLERGADINQRDTQHGGSAFGWATFHGQPETVKFLLTYEARLDLRNAAQYGCLNRVKELLEQHPDWQWQADRAPAALRSAAYGGQRAIVEWLLARGVDPNIAGPDGKTPLALAIEHKHDAIAEVLRKNGGRQ